MCRSASPSSPSSSSSCSSSPAFAEPSLFVSRLPLPPSPLPLFPAAAHCPLFVSPFKSATVREHTHTHTRTRMHTRARTYVSSIREEETDRPTVPPRRKESARARGVRTPQMTEAHTHTHTHTTENYCSKRACNLQLDGDRKWPPQHPRQEVIERARQAHPTKAETSQAVIEN